MEGGVPCGTLILHQGPVHRAGNCPALFSLLDAEVK
jgi:hypothetical protein